MRKGIIFVSSAVLIASIFACSMNNSENTEVKELSTDKQKFSYAIGLDIGASLQGIKEKVDLGVVFQAIRDTLEGNTVLLSSADATEIKRSAFTQMQKRESGENLEKQEEFLAKNKEKEGIVTTESGLQYKVLKEGAGAKPSADDKVKVHYKGMLLDGKVFDSSYKRGQPAVFKVGGVIKGWSEALQLMKEGAKYKLWLPSELAYGERGAGSQIGPNTMLVFEVELLEIME
ncbi:MAG: FKBP-type peptidyl-prolyl cis-trans isomerase [Chitinivibrionales bacterium]|nr:FKBP-type peptidyl-prolyl cis-trans isomerase [Chitinivibrionales bacterium]